MRELMLVSRRGFLASGAVFGSGLIVALSAPGRLLADTVMRSPVDAGAAVFRPSAYIEIARSGQVTLTVGKSEMGQGTLTGIAQLIADELECGWEQIRIVQADASSEFGFPGSGFMITGGSSGLKSEWMRMRKMGAAARMMLLEAAAARWNTGVDALSVRGGVVAGPGQARATFAELADAAGKLEIPEDPEVKAKGARTFVGRAMKRLDAVQKIRGRAGFGMDVDVPDMMTAVVVSPPQLMAPVKSFVADKALARPGVRQVVQISSGVAIVGDHYWAVHSARDDVEVEWGESPVAGLGMEELRQGYRDALSMQGKVAEAKGDVDAVSGGHTVIREIEQPYLAHACMEPMNFTVSIRQDDHAEAVGTDPGPERGSRTPSPGSPASKPEEVTVHTTFLGGGFGRRSAQDFVHAAAAEVAKCRWAGRSSLSIRARTTCRRRACGRST